jgi:hypothetical protein
VVTAEKKYALIIANSVYEDALLRQLVAPPQDAEALAQVLGDPSICGFEVRTLLDEPSYRVCEEIEDFFEERERDDLTLLYFSGHGITDDDGLLYYAARNTKRNRLRATAVAAPWVNEMISRCRSRRQILLLDCCHSGAFARTKSAATVNVGQQLAASAREEGRGRFVITASDAFQYSFEGDSVEGEGVYSVFTQALVQGLRSGEADLDSDGLITLDELYRFVHRRVREQTPQQSPRKWESDAEGTMVIGLNPRPAEAALPEDLVHAIENLMPEARERAIPRLNTLLRGKHRGLALAAERALIRLAEDDSRRVSTAASKCLEDFGSGTQKSDVGPVQAPPSLKPLPPVARVPSEAAPQSPVPPIEITLPLGEFTMLPAKPSLPPMITVPLGESTPHPAKPSIPPMPKVPSVLSSSTPAASETTHRAEIETPPKSVRDPRGSGGAVHSDEAATPLQAGQTPPAGASSVAAIRPPSLMAESDTSAPNLSKSTRERFHSLGQPAQILVCSAAVGLAWGAISSFASLLNVSLHAPNFLGLVAGSVLGVVLAFVLPLSVPQMPRNTRLRIVAIWIFRTIAGIIVVFPSIAAAFSFSLAARTLFLDVTLLFLDFVAGALTGLLVARATGKSLARGLVIGGLSFFLARFLASQIPVNAWGVAFYGFVRGSLGVFGVLWFLRKRDQSA